MCQICSVHPDMPANGGHLCCRSLRLTRNMYVLQMSLFNIRKKCIYVLQLMTAAARLFKRTGRGWRT
jgi:hypothetical protein